jgi:hypothetical protein
LINFILTKSAKVGRGLTKNPELRGLFDVAENSANFISILAAVGNILKAKQTHTAIKNNEIAKLMGFPNGNCISEGKLDITSAMAEAFLDISDYNKQRFGLTIDNLSTDDKKQSNASSNDEKATSMFKTIKATGTIDGDSKWGMIIKTSALYDDGDEDTTNACTCKFVLDRDSRLRFFGTFSPKCMCIEVCDLVRSTPWSTQMSRSCCRVSHAISLVLLLRNEKRECNLE